MCDALDAVSVPFATFDILGDEEIRQGLKKYSQWPTYPQARVQHPSLAKLHFDVELVQAAYVNVAKLPGQTPFQLNLP